MQDSTTKNVVFPSLTSEDVLTGILREGAQRMLATAIEAEVIDWIDSHAHLKDGNGHRQVVRNGFMPERNITTGLGDVQVRQPRVHDRRAEGQKERFTSKILPPYLRKTKSMEDLRYPFQHSTGRRSAVHSRVDGSHPRRQEGIDRDS